MAFSWDVTRVMWISKRLYQRMGLWRHLVTSTTKKRCSGEVQLKPVYRGDVTSACEQGYVTFIIEFFPETSWSSTAADLAPIYEHLVQHYIVPLTKQLLPPNHRCHSNSHLLTPVFRDHRVRGQTLGWNCLVRQLVRRSHIFLFYERCTINIQTAPS